MAEKSERSQKEERILQFWQEKNIFQKSLAKEAPQGEFVFYDGPPFATGLPHYGHILPGTVKDVIPRYKTMRGFRVPRRWGWDCHGLPIENLVEKQLGLETKKDIEKFGIGNFNKMARNSVLTFEKDWKQIIPRTGRWIDMDSPYKTMDTAYMESVWWSFKTLYDKGLVYQGFKVMQLCPHCETTLSNFEVSQGYKDITDLTVTAKFELLEEPGTYFLAWTTTPWTLPGNVALAVNPNLAYSKVRIGEEQFILAKERLSVLKDQLFTEVTAVSGAELVGKRYKTLFDYYLREGQVYGADFVTSEEGTGIVHIAPAFGEDDYNLGQREQLPFVQHVGTDGRFKDEVKDFAGMKVKTKEDNQSADVEIIKYLAGKKLLFAKEKVVHSYPHCWRCDTPLINYATSSWFVSVTAVKDKLLKNNAGVKWVPSDIGTGRFGKWLEGARDWAVSRSRFWGTPVPVWQNKDRTKTFVADSMLSVINYLPSNGNKFILVRHGEAESNVESICNSDPYKLYHLTGVGREQAEKAGEKIKSADAIYASPFMRSKETAEVIARKLGIPLSHIQADKRLGEFNFGEFEGKPFQEFLSYRDTHMLAYDTPTPGGESYQDAKNRFGQFLQDIDKRYHGKTIVIVTHGVGLEAITAVVEGADAERSLQIVRTLNPTKGSVLTYEYKAMPTNDNFELDLHRPYVDDLVLKIEGEEYHRVPEVFDTWYDSGSVPFASRGARDMVSADFIAEGLDQTRGWFYTLAVLSAALFGETPYKQVVVNGLILAEDGKKMSKKLKNYPELDLLLDKYGADALRYYLVSSQAVHADDLAFSEKGLDEVVKKLINRLDNVVSFYELYAKEGNNNSTSEHVLDRWIDIRLGDLVDEVTKYLESYELDRASRPIADFVDDLSTWYLRRSRTRPESLPKLREVLLTLSRVLAPFMPFMAEDIYLRLKGAKESVHLEEWPEVKHSMFDFLKKNKKEQILEDMVEVRRIITLALEARAAANIKVRQPLALLSINADLPLEYLEIIKDEINVKLVAVDTKQESEVMLDTQLSESLLEEGKVRDVIRTVQEWRKEQNLKPGEKATYSVPEAEKEFFLKHAEEIKGATSIEF